MVKYLITKTNTFYKLKHLDRVSEATSLTWRILSLLTMALIRLFICNKIRVSNTVACIFSISVFFEEKCYGDNHIQHFHFRRYIVGYTRQSRFKSRVQLNVRLYIQQYTSQMKMLIQLSPNYKKLKYVLYKTTCLFRDNQSNESFFNFVGIWM